MWPFSLNETLNSSLRCFSAKLSVEGKTKKKYAFDAEYHGFSHFSWFSNQRIFLVIQAKGELVSYIGLIDKPVFDLTLVLGVMYYFALYYGDVIVSY